MKVKSIKLNNDVIMPQEGFGVYKIKDLNECETAVSQALSVGYRSIDTAQAYGNESAVGAAIAKSGIPREQLFLTTKVWITDYGQGQTYDSVMESLQRLQTDYVDLIFLHEPWNDFYGAWRDLIKLQQEGRVRALGLSNFNGAQIVDLSHNTGAKPAVVQVETNLYNQEVPMRQLAQQLNFAVEAWAPLGEGQFNMLDDSVASAIGKKHHLTVAQTILRYLTQLGVIVIPKTVHQSRMKENLDIWNVQLSDEEMAQLAGQDRGHGMSWDRTQAKVAEHYMQLIDKGR